ncbi:MAG: iron ABC transporter substrate-binding protein [Myxococcota bacterium]
MRVAKMMFPVLAALVFLGCEDSKKKSEAEQPKTAAEDKGAPTEAEQAKQEVKEETPKKLVIYSGRKEKLVGKLIEKYEKEKGVEVEVQYGKSAQLAATIIEEGDKSPADLFFAQDVSTLGFLQSEGKLVQLPKELTGVVPEKFRSDKDMWVGTSGRARVLAFSTKAVKAEELPGDIDALVDERWKGKLGWAPENASFQSFVAALIAERGEEKTLEWLKSIQALEPRAYPSNTPMVTAIGNGEIEVGLTNHYYLFRLKAEHGQEFAADNHYFKSQKAGALVNSAGLGILKTSTNQDAARAFIEYVLSKESQTYFANETYEFPLIEGVEASTELPELGELAVPPTDLSKIGDLEPTVRLLREAGALM